MNTPPLLSLTAQLRKISGTTSKAKNLQHIFCTSESRKCDKAIRGVVAAN